MTEKKVYGSIDRERVQWLKSFNAGQRLIERLSVKRSGSFHTTLAYSKGIWLFCDWARMNPDEIIDKWRRDSKADYEQALDDWDILLDSFMAWLKKEKGFSKGRCKLTHATIKSLIKYNCRLRLTIGSPDPGVQKRIPPIELSEFIKMDNIASPQQKWIIRGIRDSMMSREDFATLTFAHIQKDFESGAKFIHMTVIRQKESVEYETFLGPNAVRALRTYLELRAQRGEIIKPDTLLTIEEKEPYGPITPDNLTQIVGRLGKQVNVRVSPHRLRKLGDSLLGLSVQNPLILKYWAGHKISGNVESRYQIPPTEKQRELYESAYFNIDVERLDIQEKIATIEKIFEGLTSEQRGNIHIAQRAKDIRSEENDINPCPNGEHCGESDFKQIGEAELLRHLKEGWQIIHRLGSGEVIVKRTKKL